MGLLNNVFMLIESIKDSLDGIKRQANLKGAGIKDTDELADWATRISTIESPITPVGHYNIDNYLDYLVYPGGKLTLPDSGTSVIKIHYDPLLALLTTVETLEVPETVTNFFMRKPTGTAGYDRVMLKNFIAHGVRQFDTPGVYEQPLAWTNRLERVELPNFTGQWTASLKSELTPTVFEATDTLYLDLRNAATFEPYYGIGRNARQGYPNGITLSGRFDAATQVGDSGDQAYWNMYLSGDLTFPSCTLFNGCAKPESYSHLTLRFPVLTRIGWFFYNGQGSGTLTLYIGPNLAYADNGFWNNLSQVDIHIPPGDSATKTLLDSHSATYTQDYII